MKNVYLSLLFIVLLCFGCSKDDNFPPPPKEKQITIFDKKMKAIAYIDYDDEITIYTFEGMPMAYIEYEEQVFGFNGQFLGWYYDGALYDKTYSVVGAKKGILRGAINTNVTHLETLKGIKHLKPIKSIEEIGLAHPILYDSWSETSLTDFLFGGLK